MDETRSDAIFAQFSMMGILTMKRMFIV